MTNMDIVKQLILKKLDFDETNPHDNKDILQKKIYLLQQKGIDLGYTYHWYLKGPYSPTIAKSEHDPLSRMIEISDEIEGQWKLSTDVLNKIHDVNSIVGLNVKYLDPKTWSAILASLVYIHNESHLWVDECKNKNKNTIDILLTQMPKLKQGDCEKAYEILIKNEYIKV